MAKSDGTIYFIAGLLMGGLVGAGMGMFLAPDDKKRAEMIKTGGEILDKSVKSLKKLQEEKIEPAIKDLSTKIKSEVENFDAEEFEKKVKDTVASIQKKVKKQDQTATSARPRKIKIKKVVVNK